MSRFCLPALLAFVCVSALGQGASPDINEQYRHPSYEQWRRGLESEGREVYEKRLAIVDAVGLQPGMAVADIGAGTGLFTQLFAVRVQPGGRVFAVDIAREFVDGILARTRAAHLNNVVGVVSTQTDTRLEPDSIDVAFVSDAYHHFEDPKAVLASIRRALRAGGTFVIVDYERIPGTSPNWVLNHVRGGKEEFRREIEAAGFRFVEEVKLMNDNYFLRFRRD
jgi:ubiquinone/menaquinone biosynthesis C-methylase UbiE